MRELRQATARAPKVEGSGVPLTGLLTSWLTAPCILGPGDLCAGLEELVADCEAGDASACLAVGQFLESTPPRPLVANFFFIYACKHGDQAGCARRDQLTSEAPAPTIACADDLLACAWRAYRSGNEQALDEACTLGVADACAVMATRAAAEPERARAYLESACQLGSPMACQELGRRLSPDCSSDCYPPDSVEANAAFEIACSAGWTDACDGVQP